MNNSIILGITVDIESMPRRICITRADIWKLEPKDVQAFALHVVENYPTPYQKVFKEFELYYR